MTTSYKIPCHRCEGKKKLGFKAYNGMCFTCNGTGLVVASKTQYEAHMATVATYVTVRKGRVIDVTTTHVKPSPKTPTAQYIDINKLVVSGNEITYNTTYNNELEKNQVYSAVFKHISEENTLEIITRLIKCNYKNEIELFTARKDAEMVSELSEELETELESIAAKQLSKVIGY